MATFPTLPTTSPIINTINTTAGALCIALWGHIGGLVNPSDPTSDLIPEASVKSDGRWVCRTTGFSIRMVPADAAVRLVVCDGWGYVEDSEGGWISDRFGDLGVTESRRAAKALMHV